MESLIQGALRESPRVYENEIVMPNPGREIEITKVPIHVKRADKG